MRSPASASPNLSSDDDLRLILDFTRRGRELQERHAEWLRERLGAQSERTSAP